MQSIVLLDTDGRVMVTVPVPDDLYRSWLTREELDQIVREYSEQYAYPLGLIGRAVLCHPVRLFKTFLITWKQGMVPINENPISRWSGFDIRDAIARKHFGPKAIDRIETYEEIPRDSH